jgi:hypothetical protein
MLSDQTFKERLNLESDPLLLSIPQSEPVQLTEENNMAVESLMAMS